VRVPKEDAWVYVYTEFGSLAAWWAHRYFTDPDDVYDCRIDLLVIMVDAYDKYRARGCSIREVRNILKTIPAFYYRKTLKQPTFVQLTDIEDIEKAQERYDFLYEYFLRTYYKLYNPKEDIANLRRVCVDDDVLAVLEMILFPSTAFKQYIWGNKLSVTLLRTYFKKEEHWTSLRFESALKDLHTKYKSLAG
jgi:hypothetical protein